MSPNCFLHLLEEEDTVHARHLVIRDDCIEPDPPQRLETFRCGEGCCDRKISFQFQKQFGYLKKGWFVINVQDREHGGCTVVFPYWGIITKN